MTAVVLALAISAQTAAASDRILVVPFENPQRDARIFWLGEAAAVLLTDDLTAIGASPITRHERQQAFERLQVPPAAVLTDATVIRIAQIVGAAKVILGTLQMDHEVLVVRARAVGLEAGRVVTDVTVRRSLDGLFPTFEQIARQIAPPTRPGVVAGEPHPPLAVFENYIKGLLAETPATAVTSENVRLPLFL